MNFLQLEEWHHNEGFYHRKVILIIYSLLYYNYIILYHYGNCILVAQLRDDEFCSWINHNVSYSGFTPLHYSIIRNDKDIIEYLLENGI